MLRFFGALLLVVGASALGFSAAAQLTRRVHALRAMLGALEMMEREISFRLTSMPELLSVLGVQATYPVSDFFILCRNRLNRLGEESLGQIWRGALYECPMYLREDDLRTLAELGDMLGYYDGESQQATLKVTQERLEHNLVQAEADSQRRGRMYGALGLTAGVFLVIILL